MSTRVDDRYQSVNISQNPDEAVRLRALKLLRSEIDFVPNSEFCEDVPWDEEEVAATFQATQDTSNAPSDLPAHLKILCENKLLSREQEVALFRSMNLLKFKANSLRSRIDPNNVDVQAIDSIESMVSQAQEIRDHVLKSNMRLVISIVRKLVTPQNSFDDLLSDGIVTLMSVVEKFDYDRGFRFSTYAYRSIVRNAYRCMTIARNEEGRYTRDAEEWAFESEDDRSSSSMSEQIWANLRELTGCMLNQLDRRERLIVRSRYALGSHRNVRTLQYLADKLGVSKERVRQLEVRAVGKLRAMAAEYEGDQLFSAAMV